jgi:hypothetical protein
MGACLALIPAVPDGGSSALASAPFDLHERFVSTTRVLRQVSVRARQAATSSKQDHGFSIKVSAVINRELLT